MTVADTSENRAHKAACAASESTRQNDVSRAIAADGGGTAIALAIKRAEAAHYNRLAASALANGVQSAVFVEAARIVGTHA
jgi:hypothetical protein